MASPPSLLIPEIHSATQPHFVTKENTMNNHPKSPLFEILPVLDTSGYVCRTDSIKKRAYELFERRGRGDGLDREDWLQAENEVKSHLGI
jgi:hypothetical protein